MGVVHVTITGTKEEVDDTRAALTRHTSDRRLEYRKIYAHMCQHLGVDIWDVVISKYKLDRASIKALRRKGQQYPRILWRVTDKNDVVQTDDQGELVNYRSDDPDFPGPFGALCKRYNKSYWSSRAPDYAARKTVAAGNTTLLRRLEAVESLDSIHAGLPEQIEVISVQAFVPQPLDEELREVYQAILGEMDDLQRIFDTTSSGAARTLASDMLLMLVSILDRTGNATYDTDKKCYVFHHYSGLDLTCEPEKEG